MWNRALLVLAVATLEAGLGAGCVTKAQHEALQRELDETEAALRGEQAAERTAYEEQLALRDGRVSELEAELANAEAEAERFRLEIAALEDAAAGQDAELARLEQQLHDTEKELAAVLDKRSALKASLEQMESALAELRERQRAADRRVADYRAMLQRFAGLIDAGKLRVRIVDGRMVLSLPMDILFASGQARLTEEGHASLLEVGKGLATIRDRQFQVEGHTDDVPIKTAKFPSNWELGAARALVVLRTLEEGGVTPAQLSAATYGENRPTAKNDSDEGRAANRRIEIVVVPDLSDLPGYDELQKLGGG
ncbi:MAG: OmpA family protein [Myxococcales bacterium]|nr:OmpA family protein [Myxococcales bacterium]MCB9716391.1 OmpA family protein [Myxococcales bacterium]